MSISFESDEIILEQLRKRLRNMTDTELIKFAKDVRRLAENPFQRQLEEARKRVEAEKGSGGQFEQLILTAVFSFHANTSKQPLRFPPLDSLMRS